MSKSKYDFRHNFAIIIGINNYSNGIPELETPVADAEKLAKILQENYRTIKVLIIKNLHRLDSHMEIVQSLLTKFFHDFA